MFSRRLATGAVLLALFGAACAGRGGTTVAAGASSSTPSVASVASTSTTTTTTVPPTTEAPSTTAPVAVVPAVKTPAAPAPASIEVVYEPHDGDSAVATLTGPNGTHSKSLSSGSARFSGLPAGTYAVTITIKSVAVEESDGTGIDSAVQILNGQSVHVEAGDQGVITCTDEGCTGAL